MLSSALDADIITHIIHYSGTLPAYLTSSNAFLAFFSSSFIVRRSLTLAYFLESFLTVKH